MAGFSSISSVTCGNHLRQETSYTFHEVKFHCSPGERRIHASEPIETIKPSDILVGFLKNIEYDTLLAKEIIFIYRHIFIVKIQFAVPRIHSP